MSHHLHILIEIMRNLLTDILDVRNDDHFHNGCQLFLPYYLYLYVYIYIYVCGGGACVGTYMHTHGYTYIHTYIYIPYLHSYTYTHTLFLPCSHKKNIPNIYLSCSRTIRFREQVFVKLNHVAKGPFQRGYLVFFFL